MVDVDGDFDDHELDGEGVIPEERLLLLAAGLKYAFDFDVEVSENENEPAINIEDYINVDSAHNTLNGSTKRKRKLSNYERQLIIEHLLFLYKDHTISRGQILATAKKFGVGRQTVNRLWNKAKKQLASGSSINVKINRLGRCGRKALGLDIEKLRAIDQKHRTTIRSYATVLGVSPSTIHKLLKKGVIISHTKSRKPKLSNTVKNDKMHWMLSLIIPKTIESKSRFVDMYNVVHVDEKWFFLSQLTQRYYLLYDEEDPYKSAQSKRYINKVMFLAAVGRPIIRACGEVEWDGKIGVFPFTYEKPAERCSKNRQAGTIELKQ